MAALQAGTIAMGYGFDIGNKPGFRTERTSEETQVWVVGWHGETQLSTKSYEIKSSAVDSGNTPTTTIRGGNIMVTPSTGTGLVPYSANKSGRIEGVMPYHFDMLGEDGTAIAKWTPLLVSGKLDHSKIIGGNRALYARLAAMGFTFSDPKVAAGAFSEWVEENYQNANTAVTLTADDHGTLYKLQPTSTKAFTLPTAVEGLKFGFINHSSASNVTVEQAGAETFYGSNTVLTLAPNANCIVRCIDLNGTLAWEVEDRGIVAGALS